MKVVIFCGGEGMRIREYSDKVPKPLIPVGSNTPILINIMKYYAHFGHKDFILCLGHKSEAIKDYFVKYEQYKTNNFVLKGNNKNIELLNSDMDDWTITFVDTGINVNIGTRLQKVKKFLADDKMFLASYGDVLTDISIDKMIKKFQHDNKIASFVACKPSQTYHVTSLDENDVVQDIFPMKTSNIWINGGFFILRKEIFNYMERGEELVEEPFQRLIKEKKLRAYPYNGFWASMDTFKDKQILDNLYKRGDTPWMVWKSKNND